MANSTIAHWRNYASHYTLTATKCAQCETVHFPKEYICTCGSREFDKIRLSGYGTLLTYTTVINPPTRFVGQAPYTVGIIQLDEGPKITAQITARSTELKIGMRMNTCFRKLYAYGNQGAIQYGIKFQTVISD